MSDYLEHGGAKEVMIDAKTGRVYALEYELENEIIHQSLKRAQEIFSLKGGAQGTMKDFETGKVCALGALAEATRKGVSNASIDSKLYKRCATILDFTSHESYQENIVNVNDHLGKAAVEHCYELAVKKLEGK